MQRVPHLVGCIGTIREVPVHPTTWFKIEFPDGAIVTFRPSAFKLADGGQDSDDDDDDRLVVPLPKKSSRSPAVYTNQDMMTTSMDNPDLTVGGTVRIREGRFLGETGEILKQGNGWVQVLLDGGEVSKRSHELELIGRNPSAARSRSGRAIRAHHLFNGLVHRPRKIPRVHTTFLISSAGDQDGVVASKQDVPMDPNQGSASPMSKVETNAGPTISFLYELERQELDCPFPLIDSAARKAKRHRLQAYVDRESDAVLGRPNFSLWLSRLHQSLCVSDGDKENDSLGCGETGAALKRCRHEIPLASSVPSVTEESSEIMSDTESMDEGVVIPSFAGHQATSLVTSRSSEAFFVDAVFSLARCARTVPTPANLDHNATGTSIIDTVATYNQLADDENDDEDDDAATGGSETTMPRKDSDTSSDDTDFSQDNATNYHHHQTTFSQATTATLSRVSDRSTGSLNEDPSAMLIKIRADSMYAETDNECSPELTGVAYDWKASSGSGYDCSPPPLELPPSASSSSLSSACPKDFFAWTQLVAIDNAKGTDVVTTATSMAN